MGPLKRRIGEAVLAARRDDGVAQQVGDGHRPDAARHRGDEAGDRLGLVERHVADQPRLAGAFFRCLAAVDADVDNRRAGLDLVAPDHFWPAHGGEQDIGLAAALSQVLRTRMAIVTVQCSVSSSAAIGLPTMLERPSTRARLPFSSPSVSFSISRQPKGVHGTGASSPVHSRPTLVVWKPSTSLPGSMAAMTLASSMGSGRGN